MKKAYKKIRGGITAPNGFLQSGINSGVKQKDLDLALILSLKPLTAAGVFTVNKFKSPSVLVCKDYLESKTHRAVLINSGNANCLTGDRGIKDAKYLIDSLSDYISTRSEQILFCSTGIIGRRLPVKKIEKSITRLVDSLDESDSHNAAKAIMTTDTSYKELAYSFNIGSKKVTIAGIAKGAGMIQPDMATMISLITTDAKIEKPLLQKALKEAVDSSFNTITVDGDMSTNDTVLVVANGTSGAAIGKGNAYNIFLNTLKTLCLDLAKMIVKDGEGATKFIEITVKNAKTKSQAKRTALAIANSSLFKTMCYGNDPNFGRVAAAIGAIKDNIDSKKIDIHLNGKRAVSSGVALKDKMPSNIFNSKDLKVRVDLNIGKQDAKIYTSDLSPQYVKINAAYS